jgi:hypothetical protein
MFFSQDLQVTFHGRETMQIILNHHLERHGKEYGLAFHIDVNEVPPDFRVFLQENDVKKVGDQRFPCQYPVKTFFNVHGAYLQDNSMRRANCRSRDFVS